jgi:Glycoside hydrolase 97/Glycosyl-hydrolase 97 N-terminal/Glycosyl-hydrolase 97 C-terminal, oligomerisation
MVKYLILAFLFISFEGNSQTITSPDKKIKVELNFKSNQDKKFPASGQVYFKVLFNNGKEYTEVLPESPLGIIRKDQKFVSNLKFSGESKLKLVREKYAMLSGKKKYCENVCHEKTFMYQNAQGQSLNIIFRAYNNGVAFSYKFHNQTDSLFHIIDEATAYMIPEEYRRWAQPFQNSYEDFYFSSPDGKANANKEQEWGFPLLYQVQNKPLWVLISEAGISEKNCAARLTNKNNPAQYKVIYPADKKSWHGGAISALPWESQWHVMMIGKLSDIVESTLITDLSPPSEIKDTSWIRPGSAAWVYWAYNHGSKDYQRVVEYIDLAEKMKWPYVLIDWEWDVMANGGTVVDAVNYAKSKGIKSILWYNSGTDWLDPTPNDRLLTPEKRAKEFTWLQEIGVSGIKVDFFVADLQDMMKYYIDILKDAASHKLLVNFHGATIPRGWSRTYPNLMSMEAVYGAEWYNNQPVLTNKAAVHNATLPFTRNVIGPMDYTPVTFTNSQHQHITSYSHELALAVLFESGIQHFADRPSGYYNLPELQQNFLKNFPTAWDDTKLVGGSPGEYAIIARRKEDVWYIGGINGKDTAQILQAVFNFLEDGSSYTLQLNKDGADPQSFKTEAGEVRKGDILKIPCLARGGFSGILKRK